MILIKIVAYAVIYETVHFVFSVFIISCKNWIM